MMNGNSVAFLVIFFIGYIGMLAIKYIGFKRNNEKLGKIIYAAPKGIANTDFIQQVMYVAIILAGMIALSIFNLLNPTLLFYLIGIVGVYFGFATYSIFMCLLGGRGMYEWGVRSMSGALTYDNMESYEMRYNPKKHNYSLKFTPKSGLFNSAQIMFIDSEDTKEVERLANRYVGGADAKAGYYGTKKKKKKSKKRK